MPTRIASSVSQPLPRTQPGSPPSLPREPRCMLEPADTSSPRCAIASPIASAISSAALGIDAHGCISARLVQRRMRGDHGRHAAGHRLEHRDAEALETRRKTKTAAPDTAARAPVVHVAERDTPGRSRRGCGPQPPRRPRRARVRRRAAHAPRAASRGSSAARASPPRARTAARGRPAPRRREHGCRRGCATRSRSAGTPSRSRDVARRVLRVAHDHSDVSRRCGTSRRASAPFARRPLRKAQRNEVVDRRCPDAGALRRIHPVREVEDVEAAEPSLGRRPLQTRPARPPRMGERECQQAPLDVDACERFLDDSLAAHGDRREDHDLGASSTRPRRRREHVVGHTARGCDSGATSNATLTSAGDTRSSRSGCRAAAFRAPRDRRRRDREPRTATDQRNCHRRWDPGRSSASLRSSAPSAHA